MDSKNDISIIIMSCDNYSDIWEPFTKCWDRFWPDCPYPAYLISEKKTFTHHTIKNIKLGAKAGWSDMLIQVLNKVDTPYIIYMQEDYLLKGTTDTTLLQYNIDALKVTNAAYLRLIPWPNPDIPLEKYQNIGSIAPNSAYKTSLQCALWDKKVLFSMLRSEENGWQFETNSVERSKNINRPFLSISNQLVNYTNLNNHTFPIDYFATAVLHGKWMREAIILFKKLGIHIDYSHRGILNRWDYWLYDQRKRHRKKKLYLTVLKTIDRMIFKQKMIRLFLDRLSLKV